MGEIRLPWRSPSSGLIEGSEQDSTSRLVVAAGLGSWDQGRASRCGVPSPGLRRRGRFEVQLCPVSRGSCRTAEQRKGTGVLWHFADGLGLAGLWKWMEMGKGTGMDQDATKAGSAEFASPTESARSPEGPEGGPQLCRQCREEQWQLSTATRQGRRRRWWLMMTGPGPGWP
jgi:hypothetical protein